MDPANWLWILPALFVAIVAWNLRWMSDDGWINMRVVEQVLAGNGPVFNTGQRIEVGTSTLWLWLVIAASAALPWFEPSQLAMVLGTGLMAAALLLACRGSMHLLASQADARSARRVIWIPAGAAVIAALPPIWDFATSGLEMSVAVCWLAACFAGLARRLARPDHSPAPRTLRAAFDPWWLPVLIGLGPLVRPDFALFSLAFAIALLVQSRPGIGSWLGAAVLALVIPGSYQIFRMGYYGVLVPNTALAKDASASRWELGWRYLVDFVQPYAVWLPVLLALAVYATWVRSWLARRDWQRIALVVLLPLAGMLHALYFIKVGGDFMHARFLLPATVAMLLPLAAYPLTRPARRWALVVMTGLVVWALTVAAGPRTRYELISFYGERSGRPTLLALSNERSWWESRTRSHDTVHINDWMWSQSSAEDSVTARWDAERGRFYFREAMEDETSDARGRVDDHLPTASGMVAPVRPEVFIAVQNIGAASVLAGTDVNVIDMIGLADGVSARVRYDPAITSPGRVGHEVKPTVWRLAQYAAIDPNESEELAAARRTLRCYPVRTLIRATTAPLTPRLFLSNVRRSVQNTQVAIPADPFAAEEVLCR